MMISNQYINWNKITEAFLKAKTEKEVHSIWVEVDRLCYGREDVNKLDCLTDIAYERIDDGLI